MDIFAFYMNVWIWLDCGWILGISDSLVVRHFDIKMCSFLQILPSSWTKTFPCKYYFTCKRRQVSRKVFYFLVLNFYLFYYIVCPPFFVTSQEGKSNYTFCSWLLYFYYISLYSCHFFKSNYILESNRLFYTHLAFIILCQIASDSAVSFKTKWPTTCSTL